MTIVSGLTSRNAALTKYADAVYGDGPNGLVVDGRPQLFTSGDPMFAPSQTGFFAAVYQYPGTDKFVIAFRGTDGLNDAGVDLALKNGTWHPQFDDAINFVARVAEELGIPPDRIKDRIIVTGHSGGGAEAQIVGRLYGSDGATFDPAGGARQTQLTEFQQAAQRVGVDPALNQVPETFRNYAVDGSVVSGGTGPHVGQVEAVPQMSYPNLVDLLKSAGLTVLAGNPLVMILGVVLTDQFVYKHPIGQIADTLNRLASLEDNPLVNPDGSEIRVTKLDDNGWRVFDQGGADLGTFEITDGSIQLKTADNQLVQITKDGAVNYTAPYDSGVQTLTNSIGQYGGTLIDALSIIKAIQSGDPLPITVSGLRLANGVSNLAGLANYNLSGASNVASSILSVLSLENALQRGDTMAAVTAGAQALSFGAQAYSSFAFEQALSGNTAFIDAAWESKAFSESIGKELPYLNLVNSIAHGDAVGTAVAVTDMVLAEMYAAYTVPYIGWAYAVYNIVSSLFGDEAPPPEPWGNAWAGWSGFSAVTNSSGGDGGQGTAADTYNGFLSYLNQLAASEQARNPGSAIGVVANRLPSITYRNYTGFQLTDIDPLTGVQRNPEIKYDLTGRPYNAPAGSEQASQSLSERFIRVALARGAIAPLWEAQTAALQTQAGDPQAGLTEEERARRNGKLAAPVTGDTQTFRAVALDLNGDGVQTTGANKTVAFDVDGSGYLKNTAWLNNSDGFLFLDRNLNGSIDSGRELFSNGIVDLSARGLAGMRWVDSNYDGKLTSADPVWNELKVWRDADGLVDTGESVSLANSGKLGFVPGVYDAGGKLRAAANEGRAAWAA